MVPWLERNALMFLVSLVIAGTIWIIVSPEFAPTQRNFTVPLEFLNVPSGYVVQDAVPRDVVITLQGKNSDFATLSAESLDVSLDLSGVKNAGWVTAIVSPKEINAPANFSAIEIAPQSVQVDIIQEKQ